MRTASPGPGNGCRARNSRGRPSSAPSRRTSSLKSSRTGSMSSNPSRSGNPPTLWCVLITAEGPLIDTDSITSGYSVPCARYRASGMLRASCSKTSMNVRPMILRFCSGSVTPARRDRKRSEASTAWTWIPRRPNASTTCSRSCARIRPWSTRIGYTRSPSASRSRIAVTDESTPPDRAQITEPEGAWRRIASTLSWRNPAIVQSGRTLQIRKRKFWRTSVPWAVCRTSG